MSPEDFLTTADIPEWARVEASMWGDAWEHADSCSVCVVVNNAVKGPVCLVRAALWLQYGIQVQRHEVRFPPT